MEKERREESKLLVNSLVESILSTPHQEVFFFLFFKKTAEKETSHWRKTWSYRRRGIKKREKSGARKKQRKEEEEEDNSLSPTTFSCGKERKETSRRRRNKEGNERKEETWKKDAQKLDDRAVYSLRSKIEEEVVERRKESSCVGVWRTRLREKWRWWIKNTVALHAFKVSFFSRSRVCTPHSEFLDFLLLLIILEQTLASYCFAAACRRVFYRWKISGILHFRFSSIPLYVHLGFFLFYHQLVRKKNAQRLAFASSCFLRHFFPREERERTRIRWISRPSSIGFFGRLASILFSSHPSLHFLVFLIRLISLSVSVFLLPFFPGVSLPCLLLFCSFSPLVCGTSLSFFRIDLLPSSSPPYEIRSSLLSSTEKSSFTSFFRSPSSTNIQISHEFAWVYVHLLSWFRCMYTTQAHFLFGVLLSFL